MLLIYITNNKGPKMEPCGTLTAIFRIFETCPSTMTNCDAKRKCIKRNFVNSNLLVRLMVCFRLHKTKSFVFPWYSWKWTINFIPYSTVYRIQCIYVRVNTSQWMHIFIIEVISRYWILSTRQSNQQTHRACSSFLLVEEER